MKRHSTNGGIWGFLAIVAIVANAILVSGCANSPAASTGGRAGSGVAVVDPHRVINETEAGKKALDSLSTFAKNRQAVVELEEKELRHMEEEFMKKASVMNANAKKDAEEKFRKRMMEYQQKVNQLNREVQEKQ